MKNTIVSSIIIMFVACLGACSDDEKKIDEPEVTTYDDPLNGEWLLYETGSSPGSGYNIKKVSANPAQTLTIKDDGTISFNFDSLSNFKFYRLLEDPNSESKVLALYKSDPGTEPQDVSTLRVSYSVSFVNGNLKLGFRWCVEGCHLGFKRR